MHAFELTYLIYIHSYDHIIKYAHTHTCIPQSSVCVSNVFIHACIHECKPAVERTHLSLPLTVLHNETDRERVKETLYHTRSGTDRGEIQVVVSQGTQRREADRYLWG
jgi:hypothetical protein